MVTPTLRVKKCGGSDHGSLQVCEGGQVEEALDQVRRAGLAQPQEHGVAVLQQEHAAVAQPLLRAAQWGGRAFTIHIMLEEKMAHSGSDHGQLNCHSRQDFGR